MKFEIFIFFLSMVFVTNGQETTFALSDATKEYLLKLVEGVRFMHDRAGEIIETVEFQMKSFNASANMNLAEVNRQTTHVLDRISINNEYKKCIDGERIHLRMIMQRARGDVNQCLRAGIIRAQVLRNDTIQPFDNIKLNHFVEKCIIHEEQSGCSEQEAAVVKEEAKFAFRKAYENLYKAGGEVEPLAKRTLQCVNTVTSRATTEAKNFVDSTMIKCVEAK